MKKVNKVIINFFIIAAIVIAILYGIYLNKQKNLPVQEDVFYYGITCPHCKVVEQYMEENNVSSKIQFKSKEVYQNKENAAELTKVGRYCKLGKNIGAVPLLFYNDNCYLGDKPIIDFLNKTISGVK